MKSVDKIRCFDSPLDKKMVGIQPAEFNIDLSLLQSLGG